MQVASAYTTLAGSKLLLDSLAQSVGSSAFSTIHKTLVTSFDFGITEPQALEHWLSLNNATVRIGGSSDRSSDFVARGTAFHPKVYAFAIDDQTCNVLVTSANLTSRGFTVNTEVGWSQRAVAASQVDAVFSELSRMSQLLTAEMLDAYYMGRRSRPPRSPHTEGHSVPEFSPSGPLPSFREVVESESIDLAAHNAMWVHADALQGGSKNQLELPRGGHRFFGLDFQRYDHPHNLTIALIKLRRGSQTWSERRLTWHGNNRMERFNLPTKSQGGPSYADSVVLFRRLQDGSFELVVTQLGSDLANAWSSASSQTRTLFALGSRHTTRLVGLLR
ncbi:MAG: NgoFVII family restriction endonuclease [Gammaproteobacteria bacterium]|nr:NgoFVII family restriction endonuclease [Gammaproteobacteria bacterium]